MSALTQPAPVEEPRQSAPLSPKPRRAWILLAGLVLIAGSAVFVWRWSEQARAQQGAAARLAAVRTVKVFAGPLERTVRLNGQTSARIYASITAPLLRGHMGSGLILLSLAKAGSTVKKGDIVAELDPQWVRDHADDDAETLRQAESDVEKRRAEQAVEWEDLQQTLRVAKAQYDKAQWDAKASEVKSDVERELLKLAADEAAARYKQQQNDLTNRKNSHSAELRILQITAERQRQQLERDKINLDRFTRRTPMDGLVVMQYAFRGGEMAQILVGDQVGSGQPIMKVVAPNTMQVEATANQSVSSHLRIGQPARIGMDAFPGVTLPGRVYSIGALAVSGWRENYYIRNVPIRIAVEAVDARVIPDLSAYADIILERADNVKQVPTAVVHHDGGGAYVWVRRGAGFERQAVTLGMTNATYVAIQAGLAVGDEVRIE